jgi:hypothetical protein
MEEIFKRLLFKKWKRKRGLDGKKDGFYALLSLVKY